MVLKNKINLFHIAVLFSLAAQLIYSQQDKPVISSGDIQFYMDKAVFAGNENESHVEFYFMFFADQFRFSSNNKADLGIELIIEDLKGNSFAEKNWKVEAELSESETGTKTKVFYDQVNESLPEGEYKVTVVVRDQVSRKKGELETILKIREISNFLSSSDIEFVSSVDSKTNSAAFRKGNVNIVANPSRRYGVLNPILYVYYELYNLDTLNSPLEINYSVISQNSDTVKRFPQIDYEVKKSTSGITHGFNVANIPSGIYNLNIHVSDKGNNQELILSRLFEVIQLDYTEKNTTLSPEDSKVFERLLTIIGDPAQINTYKNLPENARASYIIEFWKKLDPTPGTSENEYLKKVQQRYKYSNEKFGWQESEGWSTERGRVMIKYGMPDEIEEHHSEPNTAPYEIWYYKQEKSYLFVFGDLHNNGKYVLLHSDKEGELSDSRWPEYIRKL